MVRTINKPENNFSSVSHCIPSPNDGKLSNIMKMQRLLAFPVCHADGNLSTRGSPTEDAFLALVLKYNRADQLSM